VSCDVEGARVTFDGESIGRVPVDQDAPAGSHLIEVTADGYETYSESVMVNPEQQTSLQVSLMTTAPGGLDPMWFWVGVGVTSAFAATTIGLGAGAASHNSDANSNLDAIRHLTTAGIAACGADPIAAAACWAPYNIGIDKNKAGHFDADNMANKLEIATWVFLGLTAAAAGGTVWLYLESAPLFGGSEADITFAPLVTDSSVGLGAWGRF
jgi:hypothetical protein